jgi:hypothetical protein
MIRALSQELLALASTGISFLQAGGPIRRACRASHTRTLLLLRGTFLLTELAYLPPTRRIKAAATPRGNAPRTPRWFKRVALRPRQRRWHGGQQPRTALPLCDSIG